MAISRIWSGGATPPHTDGTQSNPAVALANRFHVTSSDLYIGAVYWYRSTSAGYVSPIAIYDHTAGQLVLSLNNPTVSGNGWQRITFGAVPLTPNHVYTVVGTEVQNTVELSSLTPVSPDSPIVLDGSFFGSSAANPPPDIATSAYGGTFALDVDVGLVSDFPDNPPPATPTDINSAMLSWLRADSENSHKDTDSVPGLPWETKQQTTAIAGVVGSTNGQLDATKAVSDTIRDLLTSANHNLGTLWDLAGNLADLEIAAWQAFFHSGQSRLTGPNSAGGSAFYTADGQLISQLVAETWQRVRVLRGDIGFGTDGWSMTAESDFEDAISFAQPADAYTLHITSYQDTQPANSSPAGLWLPRIGWWCVLTGSFAAQRSFVDFELQLLSDQGRRMPGCAIQLKPGTIATVQAWVLA